ncbi:hypothetical protein ACEZ3G_03000 [Maribacter algicola]|uniref:Uncharacterized protein n=1 Tax=Meishania litoralis TaxID=3434685 RepID=A0ACC7LG65_9FLAO
MDKEKFEIAMMEYLTDTLNEDERRGFEEFLQANPEHREQFETLEQTWNGLGEGKVPEPSEAMDGRFFEMLHGEIEKVEKSKGNSRDWLATFVEILWKPQMAYGILLLVLGVGLGYYLNSESESERFVKTTVVENGETEAVREKLVLTLLDQPSANKRLQGINEANKIAKVDEKVINALLQTLNNDANVNVRLAAIESLTNYLDEPLVREGLVQSIVKQDSPIVQVTLANLMVALQEKRSIEPFKKLMRSKELDASVKKKLETSIASII